MKTKVIHAFLWILVCMVLGITCYQCRDLRGYVILSGSMEPVIPTGSVAVVDSSKRDVRPGNIATFERHGDLVTHRILSKTEEGYQTKGDANTDPDSGTIPVENIRGTYLFCIPYLGYGFMWAKNHMFLTVGFLALFMLLVFCFPEKRPEPKEREQVKKTKRKKGVSKKLLQKHYRMNRRKRQQKVREVRQLRRQKFRKADIKTELIREAVQDLAANFTDEVAAQINGILHNIQTGESTKPNLQEQLEQTQQEFDRLLEMSLDFDEDTPFLDNRLKKLNNKIKSLKKAIEDSAARQEKVSRPEMLLSAKDLQIQEYDDALTARIIEKITVRSRNEIEIRLIGSYEKAMLLL